MPWDCLRLVLNDYKNDYAILSKKNNTTTIEIKRLRTLAIEIFKTISNIIPNIMKDIFNSKAILKSDLLKSLVNITSLQSMVTKV